MHLEHAMTICRHFGIHCKTKWALYVFRCYTLEKTYFLKK